MKYLFNDRNLIREADLASDNQVPSDDIFRTDMDPKVGSGVVSLTGPYTGDTDTAIEIEILDGDGAVSHISPPVLFGQGNGTLTTKATAPFQGATLQDVDDGPSQLQINVDDSGINRASLGSTLTEDLRAGSNEYHGPGWDFGASALDNDGNIPANAPRLSFGHDPQVYRAFKVYDYDAQDWTYSFSPPPVRDVSAGSLVYIVSGNWQVAVFVGFSGETFEGASLYDILSDMQATATTFTVTTPVTADRSPNGQASTDVSVWTKPLVLSSIQDGTSFAKSADLGFTVTQIAPTAIVVIRCIDASSNGHEVWSVTDGVSTDLANAVTGVAYVSDKYLFTIPAQLTPPGATVGNIVATFNYVTRDADQVQVPTMCVVSAFPGAKATTKRYTFVYRRRPPPGCECESADFDGGPNADCLGLVPDTGNNVMAFTDSILVRNQRLAAAVRGFVESNTSAPYAVAPIDVPWIVDSADDFADGLLAISGGQNVNPWVLNHTYATDAQVRPIVPNGSRYSAAPNNGVSGTSGATEPDWSTATTLGSTVTDGDITWTNEGLEALGIWDAGFEEWKDEMTALSGSGLATTVRGWSANTNVTLFAANGSYWCHPSTRNGWLYHIGGLSSPARTAASEPTFPTILNNCVSEGVPIPPNTTVDPISWCAAVNYWNATTAYVLNAITNPGTGKLWKVTTAGTSGGSEPNWNVAGPITDGSVVWTSTTASDLPPEANDQKTIYFEKWRTWMLEAAAAAGVVPKFGGTNMSGDGCWVDQPDAAFAFYNDDGLLPMFVNRGYHSAKMVLDPETGKPVPQSTQEFYVGLKFGCPELLQEGDSIELNIDGATGGSYNQDDTFTFVVASASPIRFEGGGYGNNRLTMSVEGSVDGAFPPYYLIHANALPIAARIGTHMYKAGDHYVPAIANGHFYECLAGGLSGGTLPAFTTNRTSYADGSAEFRDMGLVAGYDEGGLSFVVTEGGIPFASGSAFTFQATGGHFQWRQDGGSWNGPLPIGTTALADGLSAVFTGGTTQPSWAADDAFAFMAIAANGPYNLASPLDGRLTWTDSLELDITPTDNGPASRFALFDHVIPSDATITLAGSDDDFGTTPTSIVVPWKARDIYIAFAAVTRDKWKLTINRGGSAFFGYLGAPMQPQLRDPATEELKPDTGHFTRIRRVPRRGIRSGTGGEIVHDVVCEASYQDFQDGVDYACANDGGAFGVVINDAAGEVALMRFTGKEIQTKEVVFDYQASTLDRYLSFTVPLDAMP
jgi:hypothetical protein